MIAAETGEPCLEDDDCANGRCVQARDDERIRYCSQVCDGDGYCPLPMHCIESSCRYPAPSPGALGAMCTLADDCLDQMCVDSMCTRTCTGDGVCPAGYACNDASVCAPAPPAASGCAVDDSGPPPLGSAMVVLVLLLGYARTKRC